jgi:Tfp pilus assembly protein PilF
MARIDHVSRLYTQRTNSVNCVPLTFFSRVFDNPPLQRNTGFIRRALILLLLLSPSALPVYGERTCGVFGFVVAPGYAWDQYVEVLQIRDYHLMNYTYTDRTGKFSLPALNGSDYYDIVVRIDGYADYRERIMAFGCESSVRRTIFMEREPNPVVPLVLDLSGEATEVVGISELRKTIPAKIMSEFERAKKDRVQNDVDRARQRLEAIVKAAPEFYAAHNVLGTVYLELKMFRPAEAEYNEAHHLRPKSAAPLISLGSLYVHEAEAIVDLEHDRGTVALLEGNFGIVLDDARSVLTEAIRLRPEASFAHYLLGIVAFKSADYAKAEDLFNRALDIEPRLRWARLALANLYIREAKWQKALLELDAYLEDFPKVMNRLEVQIARDRVAERL